MTAPRSFMEIAGWREEFREAAKRLDTVRTGSLFPHLLDRVCGQEVRAFSLQDWTVLDQADNPLIAGGQVNVAHCCNLLWQLSTSWQPDSKLAKWKRMVLTWRVMGWANFDETRIIADCMAIIDDAFLDMPGTFSEKKGKGLSATEWPRKSQEIELCGEVMRAYPSFTYSELRAMPLAQFWQWLNDARTIKNPDYRNYQLTDVVNTKACRELNRLRKLNDDGIKQDNS